jgi:hypothetical protein
MLRIQISRSVWSAVLQHRFRMDDEISGFLAEARREAWWFFVVAPV